MARIEIEQVAKHFGSYCALDSIDLTIEDQEFMVLLGASGCGKTTLLRAIAGLQRQDSGKISIGKRRIDHLAPKDRGIAMVFQNYAVFPHLTVFENIAFGLRMHKFPSDQIKKRVQKNAELMHIEALLERYSGELSGGQRQRVAVARALAMEPDVLLMDEPLSNLDALLRLEMRAELKGVLASSKTTTIYVTHDQVEAMSLADRIAVMHQGHIIQCASPLEIYRNPAEKFVASFIGNPPMNFLPAENQGDGKWLVGGVTLAGPHSPHERILFAIRPEDISLADSGMKLEVLIVEPLGSHVLISGKLENNFFRAVFNHDMNIKTKDILTLLPKPEYMRWFDPKTEKSMR